MATGDDLNPEALNAETVAMMQVKAIREFILVVGSGRELIYDYPNLERINLGDALKMSESEHC